MKKIVLLSIASLLMFSCSSDDSGDTAEEPQENVGEQVGVPDNEGEENGEAVEDQQDAPEEEEAPVIDEPANQVVTYDADVAPLIASRCFRCHNDPTANGAPRNSTWVNFDIVSANATLINARVSNGTMPPSGGLAQAERDIISQWIADGMLEN